jgi:hypothetical protein
MQGAKQLQELFGHGHNRQQRRGTAFTVFLALALFVLCLTAIMLLAEECMSLFSCTEEDKGDCPLSTQFSIPTVAALMMPPGAVAWKAEILWVLFISIKHS